MYDKEVKFYTTTEMKQNTDFNERGNIGDIVKDIIRGPKVSILAGGSKAGKSTLALDMAQCISKGIPFLGFETSQKGVLYISLDNDDDLIQERIQKMKMDDNDQLIFCFDKSIILHESKDYSEEELDFFEVVFQAHDKLNTLGVVIIDLFDNIRSLTERNEYSNSKSAEDVNKLKEIANIFNVHIIALNHDTKSGSGNGYNSAKGGVELVGTINGAYLHLVRTGIGTTSASLEIGGRNVPEAIINLVLDTDELIYKIQDEPTEEFPYEIGVIRNYLIKHGNCEMSLSQILASAKLTIAANQFSRLLKKYNKALASEGITFFPKPGHKNGRIYVFQVSQEDDGDDE